MKRVQRLLAAVVAAVPAVAALLLGADRLEGVICGMLTGSGAAVYALTEDTLRSRKQYALARREALTDLLVAYRKERDEAQDVIGILRGELLTRGLNERQIDAIVKLGVGAHV